MASAPHAFPALSRKRALVGMIGLLAVGALDVASLAYASAATAHSTRPAGSSHKAPVLFAAKA